MVPAPGPDWKLITVNYYPCIRPGSWLPVLDVGKGYRHHFYIHDSTGRCVKDGPFWMEGGEGLHSTWKLWKHNSCDAQNLEPDGQVNNGRPLAAITIKKMGPVLPLVSAELFSDSNEPKRDSWEWLK